MARITVLLVLALHVAGLPAGKRGPPLICHELDIGSAASLPWKSVGHGMGPEPSFDASKTISETLRILATSDDAIVHMETLRRAYVYLETPRPLEDITKLGMLLKDAVLRASLPASPSEAASIRRETLAWFDLGYFAAIVNNGNSKPEFVADAPCHLILERAITGAPKDAAIHFGVGLGQAFNWFPRGDSRPAEGEWRTNGWRHLQSALELSQEPNSLVAKNLMSFFHTGYGPENEKPIPLDEVRKVIQKGLTRK